MIYYKLHIILIHNFGKIDETIFILHQAAEVIRQEMGKQETVQLWCLLGDATDDETCYQKAWELSKCKSSKAQKHWGLYYFTRKQVRFRFYRLNVRSII